MYPNNTALANLVKEFGDGVLVQMTAMFFASPVFAMVVYIAGVVMFLFTAWFIHQKKFPHYIFYFWIGWLSCMPVNGKPMIYQVLNTLTTIFSEEVSKITHNYFNNGKSIPPSYIYNAIFKAATIRIDNPEVQKNFNFLLDNCIPDVKNRDGTPLTAADLFAVETVTERAGAESFTYKFNPNYLATREFTIETDHGAEKINCFSLLEDTIKTMRRDIRNKDVTRMPNILYSGANNGENRDNQNTNWDSNGSVMAQRVEKMAMNLAQANAIQAEALNKYFDIDLSTDGGDFANKGLSPLVAATKDGISSSIFNPTRVVLNTMGLAKAITRSLNVDGFYSNAKNLYEMNEKLRDLPYLVAFVQCLLKVVFPLVCVSIFFGTLRFLKFWISAWLITLFTPWFFFFSRMSLNTMLLNANKIGNHVTTLSTNPAYLEMGVDFSAASKMLEDSSRAISVFLNGEMAIWGSLALLIPAASFFIGSGKSGGIVSKVANLAETAIMYKTGGALVKGGAAVAVKGTKATVSGAAKGFNWVRGKVSPNSIQATASGAATNDFKNYLAGSANINPASGASNPMSAPTTAPNTPNLSSNHQGTLQSIVLLFFMFSSLFFPSNSFAIGLGDLKSAKNITMDATKIITNLGLNCIDPINFPTNVAYFVKEAGNIVAGVSTVITERASLLALKKDYPNICHVLTQKQIDSYNEGKEINKSSKPFFDIAGISATRTTTVTSPKPNYYWPKYFIEVTEKGNDPHPAFARNNTLYSANRKIAYSLRKFIDTDGAIKLTSYVMGGKMVAEKLIPNFKVGSQEWEQLMKIVPMTPLEQMRVRANQKTNMTSYEAAIWPVALSETLAAHLTVCGPQMVEQGKSPGGYSWPFKGVPMTCPVAMSNDAIAYWDTGMIDYLDPEAVSSMIIGSNPLTCGMDVGAQLLSKLDADNGISMGDKNPIMGATANLTDNLKKAIQVCSWPILGPAQAIAGKALDATNGAKWKQTKCTLWGSLAPRMSTSIYSSDYSFANTALKFKLLAHELFAVPRGREERWSLAYPWEGKGTLAEGKIELGEMFKNMMGSEEIQKKLMDFGIISDKDKTIPSRSEALLIAGNPLFINASYTEKYFRDRLISMSKEAAYLAALTGASIAAGSAVNSLMDRDAVRNQISTDQMLSESDQELNATEDRTALVDEEPIYQKVIYCHKSQKRGLITGNQNINLSQSIGVGTPYNGPNYPFIRTTNPNDCLSTHQYTGCLNVSRAICRDANKVLLIRFERQEIVGYKKVQNPTIKKYQTVCKGQPVVVHKSTRRWSRFIKHTSDDEFIYPYVCEDVEVASVVRDTRQRVERPRQVEQITNDSNLQNIMRLGAMAAPWIVAETARARYGEIQGKNFLPGDRRIYTIWEKIECTSKVKKVEVDISGVISSAKYIDQSGNANCQEAIKFEVYKYIQTTLLREICDLIGDKEGEPWK